MTTYEVLSANGRAADRWTEFLTRLAPEYRDIHFLPEYGRIYRDTYGHEPLLATCTAEDGFVIQPLVRRPLRDLPFLAGASDADAYSDLANPYGFGGPLCRSADDMTAHELYRGFDDALSAWCRSERLASEFCSLHPFFFTQQRALIGETSGLRHEKDVVYIDLRQDEDAIAKGLRKGHRSGIAAARRAGVKVEKVDPNAANIARFHEMYYATMSRRQAAPRWHFPETYFPNCVAHLGDRRVSLFFASVGSRLESGCFLIHDFATAYYHFAGTHAAFPQLAVNNLLVYEAALWAKAAGYERFHLGGGVTAGEDDSLLRFKAGFSDRRAPLHTYFKVRDPATYRPLCERKRAHEVATAGGESNSDFVPLYRR
jgi:hypothetical protein